MNISACEVVPGLCDRLLDKVTAYGLRADWLTLEITETQPFPCAAAAAQEVERLRRRRFRVAIDDFGTGHSTFRRLRDIEADEVKLDRSLVAPDTDPAVAQAILEPLVRMIHELGMRVVAEGVERPAQRDRLLDCGVDALQGFLFGQPAEAGRWLYTF